MRRGRTPKPRLRNRRATASRALVAVAAAVAVAVAALPGSTGAATPLFRLIDLGTLGGSSAGSSAVNDAGQVVGQSDTSAGELHAFSWTQAGGMIDLGT